MNEKCVVQVDLWSLWNCHFTSLMWENRNQNKCASLIGTSNLLWLNNNQMWLIEIFWMVYFVKKMPFILYLGIFKNRL